MGTFARRARSVHGILLSRGSSLALGFAITALGCQGKTAPEGTGGAGGADEPAGGSAATSVAASGRAGTGGAASSGALDAGPANTGPNTGLPDTGPPDAAVPVLDGWTLLPACASDALDVPEHTVVALYHLEELRGAALLDSSGLPRDDDPMTVVGEGGTLVGGRRTAGHCGRGITLDTDDAHAQLAPVGELFQAGIALGVWLRPSSIADGESHIVGDGGGGISSFQLVLDAGYPVFRLQPGTGDWRELLRSTVPLSAGVWQYIRVSYEPGLGSLSVDGNETATTDIVMPVLGSYNTLYVGALPTFAGDSLDREFSGELDELALFRR